MFILILNVIRSSIRGFSKEILALTGVVIGLLSALRFHQDLGQFLTNLFHWNSVWMNLISFFVIFIPVVLLFSWVGMFFRKVFEGLDIVWFDAILGFVIGILKGFLWISIITLFVLNVSFLEFLNNGIYQSRFYQSFTQPIIVFIDSMVQKIPEFSFLNAYLEKGLNQSDDELIQRYTEEF
ncbi:MAG: CvpA family protein [Atribacterota bacterium]|uniref:CvpA family protein n=1 Tax=Atribacter sp. TaxID=2847780 RepID=UPI00345EA297|nr:CvpA family protein [Atribacterota bacterium]